MKSMDVGGLVDREMLRSALIADRVTRYNILSCYFLMYHSIREQVHQYIVEISCR